LLMKKNKMNNNAFDALLNFYYVDKKSHPAASKLSIPEKHRDTFNVMAALIDLPDTGELFFETRPIVDCLIQAYKKETGHSLDWSLIDKIYEMSSNGKIGTMPVKPWGNRTKHPIYAFLFLASSTIDDNAPFSINDRYIALVPFLTRRIYELKNNLKKIPTLYIFNLALIARKLVVSAQNLRPESTFNWSYISRLSIAKRAKYFTVSNGVGLMSKGEDVYILDFTTVRLRKRAQ